MAISSNKMAAHSRLHALLPSSMRKCCSNRFNRIWKDILFNSSYGNLCIRRKDLFTFLDGGALSSTPTMETIFPSNLPVALLLQIMYKMLSIFELYFHQWKQLLQTRKTTEPTSALNHLRKEHQDVHLRTQFSMKKIQNRFTDCETALKTADCYININHAASL